MKKKLLALILAGMLVCAVLTACAGSNRTADPAAASEQSGEPSSAVDDGGNSAGNGETSSTVPQMRDDLYVGILDPHKTVSAGTREVMFNVFEGLVKPDSNGDLIPAVAESWFVSDDGLTYTFTIRPDMTFHNGSPVTADDVRYSIMRCASSDEPGIVPVQAFTAITSMEAPDEHTVVITLPEPSNEFLSYLTTAVIPAGYTEQDTAPVGTGPFRYVSRTAQESVVLERYDDYWGTLPQIRNVTYRIIENPDSILLSLQSGAVDLFSHLTIMQASQLTGDFNIEQGTMNLVQAMYLNHAAEPFQDIRVRQALCHAIDKQGILDMAFSGYGFPIGSSMYPAFGKYFLPELTDYYPHDPERAKELLTEAGYPDGFSFHITVPSIYQPHMDTAQVIVEQLKKVGVTAVIEPVEWETWLEKVYLGRDFEATVIGVDASAMTARAMLERFVSTASNNFINYNNPDYDALFSIAQMSSDDAEQTSVYHQMERNLTENAANVYIQDMADLVAVRKGLSGLRFYPIYVLDLSGLHWTV